MHMTKTQRRLLEERQMVGTLRAISYFTPGTYGVLPNDHFQLAPIRILEKRGLVSTSIVDGVIMVNLTLKGCARCDMRQRRQMRMVA